MNKNLNIRPRYINVAIINQDGGTSSKQVWTNDPQEARAALQEMVTSSLRYNSPAILGAICDPFLPLVRYSILDTELTVLN